MLINQIVMKKQILLQLLFFILLICKSWSQDFSISPPKLVFEGNQLLIFYDLISNSLSDKFHVWVELEKKNGERIEIRALSGDVGDIKPGKNKKIIWVPGEDAVFIDEDVLVEIKAEKYIKSFSKGSSILMSAAVPGLGQTKISNGKPYWLTGLATYGALAGGLVLHASSNKTYDDYSLESDAIKRADLYDQAQSQRNTSSVLFISAAALWAANIIWVAAIPQRYKPLQHVNLSLNRTTGPYKGTTLLTMKFNF